MYQGKFKAKKLNSNYALQFLSVYVNLNYKHHKINKDKSIIVSSFSRYISEDIKSYAPCSRSEIKNIVHDIGGVKKYKKYAKQNSKYFIEKHGLSVKEIDFKELD